MTEPSKLPEEVRDALYAWGMCAPGTNVTLARWGELEAAILAALHEHAEQARREEREEIEQPYQGEIAVGMTFLWEPFTPHATSHLIVTEVREREGRERLIFSRSWKPLNKVEGLYDGDVFWNDESRFREACILVRARSNTEPKGA